MNVTSGWFAVLFAFAGLGFIVALYAVIRAVMTVYGIITDLSKTLRDAVDIAREMKADVVAVRTLSQVIQENPPAQQSSGTAPAPKQEPASIIPPYPTAIMEQFRPVTEKTPEPDAEYERVDKVDVTTSDEEITENDRLEQLRLQGYNTEGEEAERPGRTVEAE